MADTSPGNRGRTREPSRTLLAPTERYRGAAWRRLSFHALLGISVVAVAGAAYWWYLWYVT
ncbi:MAG: hypothetical protein ABSG53_31030, partial [Thermoguttaceae bacterium]